ASFGQGATANVPWVSFTLEPNTTSKGIYPVYLYFKNENLLILAYGISETNLPEYDWDKSLKTQKISEFYKENNLGIPFRYGDFYVYKAYFVDDLPSNEVLDQDLLDLIKIYNNVMKNISMKDIY